MFAEFAIALPLLILLFYALATVGLQIFHLGRTQLADYVLEEEVHDVLSRMIYDARAAKKIDIKEVNYKIDKIGFVCRTVEPNGAFIKDTETTWWYIPHTVDGFGKIYRKKKDDGYYLNPITGNNYFGETTVTEFECRRDDADNKLLHITLEMQSEISGHKIKISTAVYMPGCETFIP